MTNKETDPKRKKARDGAGATRQRPDGRWEHRLTLPDGTRKSVYGRTYTECKSKVRELLKDHDRGRDITKRDPLVADFLSDWLRFADDGRRAPSTMKSYRHHVNWHIVPALGHLRLSKLSAKHVDELLTTMQRQGSSARTAQITRTVLNLAMGQALKWDMVSRNVVTHTKNPSVTRMERRPLTPDQLRTFMAHTRDHRLGPLFQVAIATGMRQGELLGLHWQDIDLEGKTLSVRQTLKRDVNGDLMFGAPKTPKSRRTIALPAFAIDALIEQRRRQEEDARWFGEKWTQSDLVFTNTHGKPLDASYVTHALQEQLDAAGLPRQRFHDLRHAAATILAMQRIPPNVTRDVLGHSQIAVTMDVYTHTNMTSLREAAEALGSALRLNTGSVPREQQVS